MKAEYIDHMGDDLSVVNAARVSFSKESDWVYETRTETVYTPNQGHLEVNILDRTLSKGDKGLIRFLARGCTYADWNAYVEAFKEYGVEADLCVGEGYDGIKELMHVLRKLPPHWTPFAHTAITLRLKMPIFVARQIMKHSTGMVYNEVSRRYVNSPPDFHIPDTWREKAENVKQGSGFDAVLDLADGDTPEWAYERLINQAEDLYFDMIEAGVCPEQARMVLPQSMMTEVIATGNLYAWANLYIQRSDDHAQLETQILAADIRKAIEPLFPESWKAITQW